MVYDDGRADGTAQSTSTHLSIWWGEMGKRKGT